MERKLYDAAAKLPVSYAELDTSQLTVKPRVNNGIGRVVITFAACAAAICIVLFSALFLAGQVRQYRDAVAYFEQYGLSTEGLTHKEIKDVYLDIITGSFSHPKTAGVLASKNPTEPTGEDEEILYCPAPMTKETYKRLFSTDSDDWDPSTFWSEDNQKSNARRYYGTYNGLDVMPQKIQIQSIETYTIAGFDFICNACNIMVKKDGGAGITLQAAYERGLLTDEDIEAIYNYHKQTEAALYEEYATYYCPAPLTKQIYCQMFPSKAEYWNPDNFWSADSQSYLYRYYGMYNGYGVITRQTNIAVSQDYTTTIAGFTFITHSSHLFACKDGEMIYLDKAYEQGLLTQQDIESIYNYHMQVESTVPGQTDPEAEMLAQYFDLEMTHRPTFDEVLSIQEGTPVQDVVALLGKPHGFAPSNAIATFWWETVEGHTVLVDVEATKGFLSDPEQRTVESYFKYCNVEWVIPLVELEGEIDYTSKNFDKSGIYNAASRYFAQRAFYLRWQASTIANVIAGLVEDEHTHRAAIDAAGIEWLSSDVVIHGIDYWEWYAQVVATETVTYRENGVEKTVAILHRVELTDGDDGEIGTVDDLYFDPIANFKSCSYLEPPYETPQPNLIKPEASDALPEYTPGSIKLAAKDAYSTWAPKDRQYRASYYLIMGDFADVVRKSQPDAYNQWKSGINEAIMRGEWNDEMLLVSYIKHFNIPRASMEAALANYIYERTPEQLKMEFYEAPNLDIIYTFDNDIINNYYRYELAPTDSIPQYNLDPVTGLPIGVPEGFVLAPQDAGEITPRDRKYRICYYNAMGAFSSLGSDRPEERDAILQEIWAEVKQGIYRDEMFLVSIIKGLNISREEFDRAYAKYMLQYDPESIMTEYYEIPNGDIIYTFDNEIINAYYRYEEPDWGVVIPKLSENKDHMWFDGQEYHYVDWHIGPDAYIYRDGYYMIWGEFLELANNRPGKSLDEWVKLRIAEADTAQTCNEAALVSFLKYFEIPKEDFETALAKFLSRHTPQELSWDYYWVLADADTIYTFDNKVINEYYRK